MMNNSSLVLLLVILVVSMFGSAAAQESSAPDGIEHEHSLPSRYSCVVTDMLRYCQPDPGFWVDLGAGKAQVSIPLIKASQNAVVMLDPNAAAMSTGLKQAREQGVANQLAAVVGVAENMPFPDSSVDFLASRGSIFFWDDPAKGLQEVYRVLRPGCKAYIGGGAGSSYPAEATEQLITMRKKRLSGKDAKRWQRFIELRKPEQMRAWATQAGLPNFTIMGQGAISAADKRVGQGVWLMFEKERP